MHTEFIDKLYLELSQVTTAQTNNDLKVEELQNIMKKFMKKYAISSDMAKGYALQEVWRVLNA